MERTFVLIKPDAIRRGLFGTIISRFERVGLNIEQLEMRKVSEELITKHYPDDENWYIQLGKKTINIYKAYHLNTKKDFGTLEPLKIGKAIKPWLSTYLTSGPVIAMIISGNHAIDVVRKIIGNTVPILAEPGTIRGDFSIDSPDLANPTKRAVYNIIHASGSKEEAEREIDIWFGKNSSEREGDKETIMEIIEEVFEELKTKEPRKAAEIAYVIAVIKKNQGKTEEARKFGKASIALFKKLNIKSLEDAAARYTVINGVALPSYIHEDVVRDRLTGLSL